MLITIEMLRGWGACWSDARLVEYFAGREAIPLGTILADRTLMPSSRFWLLEASCPEVAQRLADRLSLWEDDLSAELRRIAAEL